MEYKYINEHNFPVLEITLNDGESFKLESGAMIAMTSCIKLEGKQNGTLMGALGKSLLGGENFFTTTAYSQNDGERLTLAPKGFGSIKHLKLDGNTNWYLEDGMFLASSASVCYDVKRQKGLTNSLLGGNGGFFILKTRGSGDLFVESYGSIIEIELDGSKSITIDNNHLIGWQETVEHKMIMASGAFGFKTGEGLAIELSGYGKILVQSRQPEAFARTIVPFMPTQR